VITQRIGPEGEHIVEVTFGFTFRNRQLWVGFCSFDGLLLDMEGSMQSGSSVVS
jgi:hypothetical protein